MQNEAIMIKKLKEDIISQESKILLTKMLIKVTIIEEFMDTFKFRKLNSTFNCDTALKVSIQNQQYDFDFWYVFQYLCTYFWYEKAVFSICDVKHEFGSQTMF